MHPLIIIPARLASVRLPGKPLADIGGLPMIVRVARQAQAAGVGPVVVAADSMAILEAVMGLEGVVGVLTDPTLPSGSDRVAAALAEYDPQGHHDIVINLQGDLPFVPPEALARVLLPMADKTVDVGTLVTRIHTLEEAERPSVVKAVCAFAEGSSEDGCARALYFSRLPVPAGSGPLWHHVGLYAWRRTSLERFVRLPPSLLEEREKLEQLRALEAGMHIACATIREAPPGVDTAEDLARARKFAAKEALIERGMGSAT